MYNCKISWGLHKLVMRIPDGTMIILRWTSTTWARWDLPRGSATVFKALDSWLLSPVYPRSCSRCLWCIFFALGLSVVCCVCEAFVCFRFDCFPKKDVWKQNFQVKRVADGERNAAELQVERFQLLNYQKGCVEVEPSWNLFPTHHLQFSQFCISQALKESVSDIRGTLEGSSLKVFPSIVKVSCFCLSNWPWRFSKTVLRCTCNTSSRDSGWQWSRW